MGVSRKKDGWPTVTQIIAHRGASSTQRENTLEAFRSARTVGADAVELDVRRTRDGVLVVHHDPSVASTSPDTGRTTRVTIIDTDAAALPVHIPRVGAALDVCAGMWVNVEIKNDPDEPDFDDTESVAEQTMALLIARGEPDRWLVSSFRLETIDRCRAVADDAGVAIRTAWLTMVASFEPVPDAVIEMLVARGHAALHPWVRTLERSTVAACHRAGLAVNAWTCDDPRRMGELIEWEIDGICTNVPDVGVSVVAARGARS